MAENNITPSDEAKKYFPFSGLYHVTRNSFYAAGQDSWTNPPAQNSDLFQSLVNTEPVLQGVLKRRRGYSLFSNPSTTSGAMSTGEYAGLTADGAFGGGTSWSSVTSAEGGPDTVAATVTLSASTSSDYINATTYGFNLAPGAIINGIEVVVTGYNNLTTSPANRRSTVSLTMLKGGVATGSTETTLMVEGYFGTMTLGSPTDLWGTTWSSTDINASNFGVRLQLTAPSTGNTVNNIDSIQIIVYTQQPYEPYTLGYSFRNEALGLRSVVWTSPSNVLVVGEDGSSYIPSLYSPASNAGRPRMVNSRNYGYFADGATGDNLKWDGTSNSTKLTNWGINIANSPGVTYGPNTPTSTIDQNAAGGNSALWTITSQTAPAATATIVSASGNSGFTDYLVLTNFGFSIPANANIVGVELTITGFTTSTVHPIWIAGLVINGSLAGTFPNAVIPTGSGTITFGSSTSLPSGVYPTAAQVNSTNFGFYFNADNFALGDTVNVSGATLTIYTNTGTITITPGGGSSGNITLLSGRTYFAVFQNSSTGTTSGLNPASVTTGPLTNQDVALSTIPVSIDPQVSNVLILATADGNDQTKLFLLASISNGTTTYTDNTPDTQLLTQVVYQETQSDGSLHGVANNNPPPLINFPTLHKGRIYGSIGNTIYFSKNLTDVTTSTGTITTKWEEAWPATYQMDLSATAEEIQGIMSDGETLWIATEYCIRRLVGDSPANFQLPEIQFNQAGLVGMETWKVAFNEDQPVGTFWLTPDFVAMFSDFNTYQDIGMPVQDVLNSINPLAVSTIHAAYVSKGQSSYAMLYLPIGSATEPNVILVYNLSTQTWSIWNPTDLPTASLFMFDAKGDPLWLFATNAGPLYNWDSTVNQDRNGNTPVSYATSATTSWLDMGDPALRKSLNQILVGTGDSSLTVSINGAILEADLVSLSPPVVIGSTPVSTGPLSDLFIPLAATPSYHKWFQFTFVSPASTVANFLEFYSVETLPLMRWA